MDRSRKGIGEFLRAPLEGRESPSRVFWLYGALGSLLYSCLGFLVPPEFVVSRLYSIGGLLLTLYVIVATYRCAKNCRTEARARWVLSAACCPFCCCQ